MRPSESAVGLSWLANFHEVDRPAATVLIDAMRFVSFTRLWQGLLGLVRGLDPAIGPYVLYPERALPDLGPGRDPADLVAWQDFHPGADLAVPAGSDAFVAMVLKELEAIGTPGGIPPGAGLDDLAAAGCRSIVIVTDNTATGHQAEALARAILRNPTVRSWRSYGLVRVRVAAFIASPEAVAYLETSRYVDSVHFVEVMPTLHSVPLAEAHRQAAIDVCLRYGHWPKLGYGEVAALFATERRAPDNMPSVFLQQGARWRPLFPDRHIPESFTQEVGDHRPAEAYATVAERLGELRLGRNQRASTTRGTTRDALQVLTLASHGTVTPGPVAASLGVDIEVARRWLSALMSWGLLSDNAQLTEAGRRELREYRRAPRQVTAGLKPSDEPYYHVAVR